MADRGERMSAKERLKTALIALGAVAFGLAVPYSMLATWLPDRQPGDGGAVGFVLACIVALPAWIIAYKAGQEVLAGRRPSGQRTQRR